MGNFKWIFSASLSMCCYAQFFFFWFRYCCVCLHVCVCFYIKPKNIQCYVKQLLSIKSWFHKHAHLHRTWQAHNRIYIHRNQNDESFRRLFQSEFHLSLNDHWFEQSLGENQFDWLIRFKNVAHFPATLPYVNSKFIACFQSLVQQIRFIANFFFQSLSALRPISSIM